MPRTLNQVASASPSQQSGSYLYTISPTAGSGIACLTSADELLLLDRLTLSPVAVVPLPDVPKGVTCMIVDPGGSNVICAGRDGLVSIFDVRSHKRMSHFKIEKPVSAMTCQSHEIAVGSELVNHETLISVWDRRKNEQRWQSTESNDDITDLHFHPAKPNRLLSGGVDGLVSIFDTNVAEADESLLQVVNHSSIHKAGFLNESAIYALSHDEQFAIYAVSSDDDKDDPQPVRLGDVRPILNCEYAIDVCLIGLPSYIAVGTHSSDPRVELVEIHDGAQLNQKDKIILAGSHGDEVVRSIFAEPQRGSIFSAGEDGQIRVFQETVEVEDPQPEKTKKARRSMELRYQPY